jgi:aspartate ammonia-lyase
MNFAAIAAIIGIAKTAIETAKALREVAMRNRELTEEEAADLDRQIAALQNEETKPAHWRIEP